MRVAWAAPVGGNEGRRAGEAERRARLTGEIFSTETVLSSARPAVARCRPPGARGRTPDLPAAEAVPSVADSAVGRYLKLVGFTGASVVTAFCLPPDSNTSSPATPICGLFRGINRSDDHTLSATVTLSFTVFPGSTVAGSATSPLPSVNVRFDVVNPTSFMG